jgi:hypothetical protein
MKRAYGTLGLLSPSARVTFGLCAAHLRRSSRRTRITLGLAISGLALISVLSMFRIGPKSGLFGEIVAVISVLGLLLLFAAFLSWVATTPYFRVIHTDRHYLWMGGIDPSFLMQFPEAHARQVE